ncbi:MAG: hypothetical protein JXA20_14405 [Spirochaetes bacterium]|nr:hypothetical protein [Spirochaetota bacterium]
MRRCTNTAIICAAAILFILPAAREARGAGLSVGANSFYAWWSPSFKDFFTNRTAIFHPAIRPYNVRFDLHPSFLVGPSLSLSLPAGFTLNAVFLWSSWYHAESTITNGTYTGGCFIDAYRLDIQKWDLDVNLNYALTDYLKLFMGMKHQGYTFDYSGTQLSTSTITPYYGKVYFRGVGPGLGISLNINLAGPLFLLTNLSTLYLYSADRMHFVATTHLQWAYHVVGFNGTVSLAWYIEPASLTVSLGFRYQYLCYYLWDSRTNDWFYTAAVAGPVRGNRSILTSDDHFYGITLSAVYSFNFGGDD